MWLWGGLSHAGKRIVMTMFRRVVAALIAASGVISFLDPPVEANGTLVTQNAKRLSKRFSFSGSATWYDVETYQQGCVSLRWVLTRRACGQWINNDMHIVALNEPMYGDLDSVSSWCGKHIMIANGLKTVKAVIMDACPETKQCHHGALDMSMSLFQEFHGLKLGVFPITWWTVDEDDSSDSHGSTSSSKSSTGVSSSSKGSLNSRKTSSTSSKSSPTTKSSTHERSQNVSSNSASASRASAASAASSSSSKAVAEAYSDAAKQSQRKASAKHSKSSVESIHSSSSSSSSSRSTSTQATSSSSSSSSLTHSMHSTSSDRNSRSSRSNDATSSSSVRKDHDSGTGTGGSSDDDPQSGNLQNFVKVLNGLSMLVHAAV